MLRQGLSCRGMSHPEKSHSNSSDFLAASMLEMLANGSWRAYDGIHSERLSSWLSQSLGVEHVRLCCSGTLAVELALRGLKIRSDDEVILSSYDFPGNFRSIEDLGAQIVLCEPSKDGGWVLDVNSLEKVVSPKCKGLIVSHLHGQLAPMKEIMEWARSHGIRVVEDACQAHGAMVDGKPAGSWGDAGVFSYGGSKLVSAGRGGAVVTNDPLIAQRMTIFCERGNNAFPLSEVQAALIASQYLTLATDHQSRLDTAKKIVEKTKTLSWLNVPYDLTWNSPAFYKLGFLLNSDACEDNLEKLTTLRNKLIESLRQHGIDVGEGFRGFGSRSPKRYRGTKTLERCQTLAATTVLLHHTMLLNPQMGTDAANRVWEALEHFNTELQP